MTPSYEIIPDEIGTKGKGYLIIRSCPPDMLADTLRHGTDELLVRGARYVFAASTDPESPLAEGDTAGLSLTHIHDMLRMERPLAGFPSPDARLSLEPLTRPGGKQYLTLYNECFFSTPNSATYTEEDLERILGDGYLAGFALSDHTPVGVYELSSEDIPEICSVALRKMARGRGLGRQLLLSVMSLLAGLGYENCRLLVSSVNHPAYQLYLQSGFQVTGVLSRWFSVQTGTFGL